MVTEEGQDGAQARIEPVALRNTGLLAALDRCDGVPTRVATFRERP